MVSGMKVFVTMSDGMRPGFFAGDVVVVRTPRRNDRRYSPGEVVAVRPAPGSPLSLRRITDVVDDVGARVEYLACGDGPSGVGVSTLGPDQIVGRVGRRFANLGRWSQEVRSHRSRFALSRTAQAPKPRRASGPGTGGPA